MKTTPSGFAVSVLVIACLVAFVIPFHSVSAQEPSTQFIFLPMVPNNALVYVDKPVLISPADGTVVDSLIPRLTFDMKDSSGQYSGVLSVSKLPQGGDTDFSLSFGLGTDPIRDEIPWWNLDPATTYYWRVGLVIGNDYQNPVWSNEWTFATPPAPVYLPAPEMVSPSDDATVSKNRVDFSWKPVAGVVEYKVLIRDNISHNGRLIFTSATSCYLSTAYGDTFLVPSRTYTWNVTARDNKAWGVEPADFSFTTEP